MCNTFPSNVVVFSNTFMYKCSKWDYKSTIDTLSISQTAQTLRQNFNCTGCNTESSISAVNYTIEALVNLLEVDEAISNSTWWVYMHNLIQNVISIYTWTLHCTI